MSIAVIMGSKNDDVIMNEACLMLEQFNVEYKKFVVSAHRTPDKMVEFAHELETRGFQIVIAGAGGAAHLPGMVSAITHLPVIGVPIQSKALSGLDSLYSIVQMPKGIPVSTMAINGAANAALSAIEILALSNEELSHQYKEYKKELASSTWENQFE